MSDTFSQERYGGGTASAGDHHRAATSLAGRPKVVCVGIGGLGQGEVGPRDGDVVVFLTTSVKTRIVDEAANSYSIYYIECIERYLYIYILIHYILIFSYILIEQRNNS